MNISIIGGGAWGTTLAQVLSDNGNDVLIRDINEEFIKKINETHKHPYFEGVIPSNIKATNSLNEALAFSDVIVLCVPTKVMRMVLHEINTLITNKKLFVNVSKGIEPSTSFRVSQIVAEEINPLYLEGYVALSGPSHAEEVILRKVTSLVAASTDEALAIKVQHIFSNDKYIRVYTSDDVIGVECGGSMKNAIAIVSGVASGMGLGENARAFLITRGIKEIIAITQALGGKMETVYGLSGIGDLIVTASSMNSRNFQCGLKIGQGMSVSEAEGKVVQSVEGIRAIEAGYEIGKKYKIDLPIINAAYEVVKGNLNAKEALEGLLKRSLKTEKYW
ncbi:MAG: NAD(P)-dependent glycerol-3-phosphate dehydrogenase [Acholeplasmatales bacterium]|nr:NAD(P)-dependent glycerol-3-phosphate dehydrogenase [Acholeplasmatales bacterium]